MSAISRATLPLLALSLAACSAQDAPPLDGDWTVQAGESRLSFVTVKNGSVAEAHGFTGLSGSVSGDGEAELTIDLATVATNVDIRDERMRDLLFETGVYPAARVTAQLDPTGFSALGVGESTTLDLVATLDLHGMQEPLGAELVVTRTAEDKVLVQSARPIIVEAGSFGLAEGVEQLRSVAGLESITGAVPVTLSVTFTR